MQQRIDHGVLEVGAPPPGHKLIWPPTPSLLPQIGRYHFRQTFLHVHHRAVLVEHTYLDLRLERLHCHLCHETSRQQLPARPEGALTRGSSPTSQAFTCSARYFE